MKSTDSLNSAAKVLINLKFSDGKTRYVGWLAVMVLGVMSFIFYLERTAILDASYQTFAIIFHNSWAIQVERFGAVMTKWPAYLGFKQGWGIDFIMRTYSMAFILFLAVLFAILKLFRNQKTAILLLLFYTLLVSHTFFWIQSELLQGTAFTIFFFGLVLLCQPIKWWHFLIALPLQVTIAFFHPLTFIPFAFLWLFFLLSPTYRPGKLYWGLPLLQILILFYKHFIRPANDYDAASFGLIKKLSLRFFSYQSNFNFIEYCWTDYYFFPLLLVAAVIFYISKKHWLKLGLLLITVLGYFVMIHGSFPNGAEQFYIESYYQVLTVFVATPLIFDILPAFVWTQKRTSLILLTILLISVGRILYRSNIYSDRLAWNLELLERTKAYSGTKFLVNEKDINMEKYLMAWGSPFETLLLSSRQSPDSTRTFYIFNEGVLKPESREKQHDFLTPFGDIPFRHINKNYFNFQDTSQYILLGKEDLPKWE